MTSAEANISELSRKPLIKRPLLDTRPKSPVVRLAASPAVAQSAEPARARLSPTAAFYLQASIAVAFFAGSSAPSPLYPLYQSHDRAPRARVR